MNYTWNIMSQYHKGAATWQCNMYPFNGKAGHLVQVGIAN